MHRWWLVSFTVLLWTPAFSAGLYDLKVCEPISDSAERLQCYDRAMQAITGSSFERGSISTPAQGTAPAEMNLAPEGRKKIGAWSVLEDGLDAAGEHFTLIYARSTEFITIEYGEQVQPELVMRCKAGRLDAYVNWKTYIGQGSAFVVSKIGDKSSVTDEWQVSGRGEATFYPRELAGGLLYKMVGADSAWFRVSPPNSDPVTAGFTISGAGDVSAYLRDRCSRKGEPSMFEILGR
ncbi:type VI secretion system-associated protein TagO [Methylophaga sp. OBS4]|uniref:type VI secretion system-associated protein TagO n=1 Tax=Methylophaga sp. OBS4 TaxID=2991935 RepID=UPI00225AAE7D|nr:type VI secretion system-associated protein TagO [Methylophaga sp. OBS4]MCX4186744.1 type VI secretion system-associated protein TagO [Methylophaga sp. OBS4]